MSTEPVLSAVLGALTWEPQVRGTLILLAGVLILIGSVWLLLATNIGSRLGFLVAGAGLFGWLSVLTLLWTITPSGTGPKGRDPLWEIQTVVSGEEIPAIAAPPLDSLAEGERAGWTKLEEGEKELSEAQAAADEYFNSDEGKDEFGFGVKDEEAGETSTYELAAGYSKGGETYFLTLLHKPHYAVVQVNPVLRKDPVPGQPVAEPEDDPDKAMVTVLMVRDLGTRRLTPFLAFCGSAVIFAVFIYVLHRRDKLIWAARGAEGTEGKG